MYLRMYDVIDVTDDTTHERALKYVLNKLINYSKYSERLSQYNDTFHNAQANTHSVHGDRLSKNLPFDILSKIYQYYHDDYALLSLATKV